MSARFQHAARGAALPVLLLCLCAAAPKAETAAQPVQIGGGGAWTAYSYTDNGGKVCYLIGQPTKSVPADLKRGRIDALVTHREKEKTFNVVNFEAGYPFKTGAPAELAIDGHKFSLFTEKEGAWTNDAATDKAVTLALAKGRQAVFTGVLTRGTAVADTYPLDGFGKALAAIDKACAVKR